MILWAATLLMIGSGCERTNLFAPQPEDPVLHPVLGPSGIVAIAITTGEGETGASWHLSIETNGYARLQDSRRPEAELTTAMPLQTLDGLVALFLAQDFLHMPENQVSAMRNPASFHRIFFRHGGSEKIVAADPLGASAGLQVIISHLQEVAEDMRNIPLALTLRLSTTRLEHGQSATLTLVAHNRGGHAVELAAGPEVCEFFALPPAYLAPATYPSVAPQAYVWQHTQKKEDNAAMRTFHLLPGDSLVYQTAWAGRSAAGEPLQGQFWIGAQLKTLPGGHPALQLLTLSPGTFVRGQREKRDSHNH